MIQIDSPKTPADVHLGVKRFNTMMRDCISVEIISLLMQNGRTIVPKKNKYNNFPSVHSEDDHCVIYSLEKVELTSTGNVLLKTDGILSPMRMKASRLSTSSLLQIWEILLLAVDSNKGGYNA